MNEHRKVRLLLYDYVRGVLAGDDRESVERHLANCAQCSAETESERETLRSVPVPERRPSDGLPASYWAGFANEVMGKIPDGPVKAPGLIERIARLLGGWFGSPAAARPAVTVVAAFGSIAVIAAVVWLAVPRGTGGDGDPAADGSGEIAGGPGANDDRAGFAGFAGFDNRVTSDSLGEFDKRLANYFRKSKTLLVGVSNIVPGEGEEVDLETERLASRKLLREARYLRAGPVDPRSSRLIDDLDRILIGLANAGPGEVNPEIETIRTGIENRNLLFKLRMQEADISRVPVQQASYHPRQ